MRAGDFGALGNGLQICQRLKLTALVFDCLEAVLLSVRMRCRNGRMGLPRQLLEDLRGRHIAKRTLHEHL